MRLDFKKLFSFVLALVMMVSTLTVVNVVSVSAAMVTDTWTAAENPTKSWLDFESANKKFESATCSENNGIKFKDNIFSDGTNDPNGKTGYKSSKSEATFDITTTQPNSIIKIWCYNGNDSNKYQFTVTAKNGGTATPVSSADIPLRTNTSAEYMEFSFDKADTYTFKSPKAKVFIFQIELSYEGDPGGGTDERYTWKFDETALTQLTTDLSGFDKTKLEFGVGDAADGSVKTLTQRNLLVYKADNYIVVPTKALLYAGLKDGADNAGEDVVTYDEASKTYTVKPTQNMFKAAVVVPNENIQVTDAENRILHLRCNDNMVVSILLDDQGKAKGMLTSTNDQGGYDLEEPVASPTINLHADTYTASISGGQLDNAQFVVDDGTTDTYKQTFTATTPQPFTANKSDIDVSRGLVTATALRAERLYGGTVLADGYFRVVGKGYQNVFSLSGDIDDPAFGEDAKAIVLRAASTDSGTTIAKGGIGFSTGDLGQGKAGKLTLSVQGVKDSKSEGIGATLGLAKTTGEKPDEEVVTDVDEKPITATDDGDVTTVETVVFENLESNANYAVYNKGNVNNNGNIRIYKAKFEVVDAPKNVTVKFTLTGNDTESIDGDTASIKITKLDDSGNDTSDSKTLSKQGTQKFENVPVGTKFKFSGEKVRNVYQWLSITDNVVDSADAPKHKANIGFFNGKENKNRFFIYTVPEDAQAGKTYGVQFTAASGKMEELKIESNKNSHGINSAEIGFGQYGFGADKVALCGNDAREKMTYDFEVAGLSDYQKGYCTDIYNTVLANFNGVAASPATTNEYGILNDSKTRPTYVTFKLSSDVTNNDGGKIQAIIDRSGEVKLTDVTGGDTDVASTPIMKDGKKNKQSFVVEAGHEYKITSATGTTYIKSMRILNPNNIFDKTDSSPNDEQKVKKFTKDELSEAGITLEQEVSEGASVFRVIGAIAIPEEDQSSKDKINSFLGTIDSVGFDAYKKKEYDEAENKIEGTNHFNDNSTANSDFVKPVPVTITFNDIANLAVDLDNNKENGTALGNIDGSTFEYVYVQTFFEATENMVLVPWVKYDGGESKVFSLINENEPANNVVLTVN